MQYHWNPLRITIKISYSKSSRNNLGEMVEKQSPMPTQGEIWESLMKSIWLDHTITLLNHFGPSASFLFYDEEWEPLGSTWPIEIDGTIVTGYFLDTLLPFGLQSSPALFLKFVDGLKFVMSFKGASPIWNYLDNFWTCGLPSPLHTARICLMLCWECARSLVSKPTLRKHFNRTRTLSSLALN